MNKLATLIIFLVILLNISLAFVIWFIDNLSLYNGIVN